MVEVRQTETYGRWFDSLRDRQARVRIDVRIRRLSLGNPGAVRPIGEGVSELRIDYGPGYRVYLVRVVRCLPLAAGVAVRAGVQAGRRLTTLRGGNRG